MTVKNNQMDVRTCARGMFFSLFVLVGAYIAICKPIVTMASAGQHVLAGAVVMIGMWIIKPFGIPFAISSLFFVVVALINKIPGDKVFVGFTGNALWVLISALFFGYILITTDLGKRLAYLVISGLSRIWQPSYLTLMIAWVIIGVLLSFLTASIAVRVSIVTPIAISFLEACKIEPRSRGAALLLLTAWFCAMLPGSGLLTGALYGPIIQGMFNGEASLHGIIDYASWLEVMLLPITIISVITVMGGYFFFKPKEKLQIDREYFVMQYKALGPFSRKETIAAVIFAVTFLFYLTASYHHIPDVIICLGSLILMSAGGMIDGKDVSVGISWDLVIFVGIAMGFGSIMNAAGIYEWLGNVLISAFIPFTSGPWMFMYGVLFLFLIVRFFDIATFIPTMALVTPLIPTIAVNYGIDPKVFIPLFVLAANCYFMAYQNLFALAAEAIAGDKSWKPKEISQYGIIYFIAMLIALAATVPYYISLGFFRP